jgi:glutamate synthase (NADPH/NADH) large chain
MKTGRDIAIAALLGAEEWGVATAALIVEGCIMMRKCHMNTCPVGVATQDPELRKRFTGNPDHVVNFFEFITQELREIMAELGFRTVNEMIGQVDALRMRDNITHWKYKNLDLSGVLYKEPAGPEVGLYCTETQDHGLSEVLDWELLKVAQPAISKKQKVKASFPIKNTNRTVGTIVSNEITKVHKAAGLPEDTIHFTFKGTAGQSFGAFNTQGVTLELEGDANDYFGKGLSGAHLIVYPDKDASFVAENNIIIGNVAFYGATSGQSFIRGKAGERFAVRNSGATVVVEGVGDHGCEYMTGGVAVILGATGRNFAAGMSGGIAFVYDTQQEFSSLCNHEMVDLDPVAKDDIALLKDLIQKHFNTTGSSVAKFILADFDNQLKQFIKVFPRDYKKVLQTKKESVSATK